YTDDAAADIIASLDDQGSNANGWWRRNPDGTIDQWGVYNGNSPHPGISFPLEFPTACENVQITALGYGATSTGSESTTVHLATLDGIPTTAGFAAWCSWESSGNDQFNAAATLSKFHWRAIGR
ncbi:MAG: hypothetical protein Q8L66_01895, partial [Caulobacter sp.]|nr:hypothetical protein [Caulobacter sp.]